MDTALAILPWILPPLLGAIIGYVTNRIAIKMLFRPLTPKRIWGVHIPLTPGVIPRNRFDLARTIGRMVSEQLLSPAAIKEQLDKPEFRENIARWIGGQRRALMQRPIRRTRGDTGPAGGPTVSGEPADAAGNVAASFPQKLPQTLPQEFPQELLEQILAAFLQSPQCRRMAQSLAHSVVSNVSDKRIEDITDADQLANFVHGSVLPAFKSQELRSTASELVNNWLREQFNQNKRLKEYLTPENLEAVQVLLHNNLPTATWLVFNWLRQPDMSQKLVQIGEDWLEDTVRQQSLLTRAILSLSGKKEEAIRDMPNIIGRIIDEAERSLSTPEMQALIAEAVSVTLERISSRRIKWLIGRNEQTIYWMADRATQGAFAALSSTSAATVRDAAQRFYQSNSQTTLGEMAERTLGLKTTEVSDMTATLMMNYLANPSTPGNISKLALQLETNGNGNDDEADYATLGELIPISEETGELLDQYAADRLVGFMGEQLPELSKILDVETLVTDRINSFDVKDVEELVMSISGKHLRWINWFGAGLGAMIGLIQLAVNPPL